MRFARTQRSSLFAIREAVTETADVAGEWYTGGISESGFIP